MSLHFLYAESPNQGLFQSPLSRLAVLPTADSISNDSSVPAVHNGDHMTPTSIVAKRVVHVRGPSLDGKITDRSGRSYPETEPLRQGAHSLAFAPDNPLHLLPACQQRPLPSKHHRNAPVSVAGVALNQVIDGLLCLRINSGRLFSPRLVLNGGPRNLQPFGYPAQADSPALFLHQCAYSEDKLSSSGSFRILLAFFKTSLCNTSSPLFSRWALSSSSYTVSTFFGLARRPCRPYSMNLLIQGWISLCLRSYSMAALTTVFCPLMSSKPNSGFRLAVHLSIFAWLVASLSMTHPLSSGCTSYRWYSRSGVTIMFRRFLRVALVNGGEWK